MGGRGGTHATMARLLMMGSLAVLAFGAAGQETHGLRTESFSYAGTVDGTTPLWADAGYLADGKPKPLVAVMHGYSGDRHAVALDVQELAAEGVFAVAPDMRGGESAGRFDSGGVEVCDIVDALLAAAARWPDETDPTNLNVVGYSGGGGNALAAMVRFPDLFHVAVSFFGISDYGWWYRSSGRPDCNERMVAALGGTPEELPQVYAARNFTAAAGNNGRTRLHLFWDEEERACPPGMTEEFLDVYRLAGHDRATVHLSHRADGRRWRHNYRAGNRDLSAADPLFLADIRAAPGPLDLPPRGRLVVPGYLITRHFQVWVEDGQRGVATIEYDLTGEAPRVTVVENPFGLQVRVVPHGLWERR